MPSTLEYKRTILSLLTFTGAMIPLIYRNVEDRHLYEHRTADGTTVGEAERFQNVSNSTAMFIYSAYYEGKLPYVRVMAIVRNDWKKPEVFCLLRYDNETKVVKAFLFIIKNYFRNRYSPFFILCNLTRKDPPPSLTISSGTNFNDTNNEVKVTVVPGNKENKRNFTACVSPIHSNYSDWFHLIEWIEMHKLFGVERIYVYVNKCSHEVMRVLEMYQAKQLVVIINWPLSICTNENAIHYCGQKLALNDCVYRTKGHSHYISATDLDEFIVPQREDHVTWNDMLGALVPSNTYLFRNAFFFTDENIPQYILKTQTYFKRENYIYNRYQRTKFISVTDTIVTMGVHFPLRVIGNMHVVNASYGLLHHFRYGIRRKAKASVLNTVMKKYRFALEKATAFVDKDLK